MKELTRVILQLASNDMAAIRRYDSGRKAEAFGLLGSSIRGTVEYLKQRAKQDPEFRNVLLDFKEQIKNLEGVL